MSSNMPTFDVAPGAGISCHVCNTSICPSHMLSHIWQCFGGAINRLVRDPKIETNAVDAVGQAVDRIDRVITVMNEEMRVINPRHIIIHRGPAPE